MEFASYRIRVNTVALAFVETPAYERFMTAEPAREALDSVNAFHPLGRHGQQRTSSRRSSSTLATVPVGSPARSCPSTAVFSRDETRRRS
jgi:NAD(P)-dependent dehydrogenase (short-subunit alcohol dehydrogenase family)